MSPKSSKLAPIFVASPSDLPPVVLRAERAVADARAYAAKPATDNLADFRERFVRPIFGPVLADSGLDAKTIEAVLAVAPAIAGTYSRYQDAKRAGLLDEIAAPTAYRIGKAPARKPATKPAKPAPVAPVE